MTLWQIMKRFRLAIGMVVFFILIENLAWIIEPSFFGKLLDALIDHFYDHEKVTYSGPLFIWIMIYLLNMLGGALGRFYGGKIYSRMYADIATQMVLTSRDCHHPVSKTLARAELAREYIVFLKDRIPEILWQASATIGVVIALFFYDWRIAAVMLVIIIPVFHINRLYRKHVIALQKNIHDSREELFSVVEHKDITRIHEFYMSMVKPQTSIARWNSVNYGILKFLLMLIFIVILFIAVDVDNFTTGSIYAIAAYIWTFISSVDYLPGLMESWTVVKELSRRLGSDVPVIENTKN
jgi:ABC-type multidrug transport system fused ATPase/permease subunit